MNSPMDDAASAPVFDPDSMMARFENDTELAKMVIEGFLEDIPNKFITIKACLENADGKQATILIHSVKGAAANISGERLRITAFKTEKKATLGDWPAVTADMPELEKQYAILADELKCYLTKI